MSSDSEKAYHTAQESSSKRQKLDDKELFAGLDDIVPTTSDGKPTVQGSKPGGLDYVGPDVMQQPLQLLPLVESRNANLPPIRERKHKELDTDATLHYYKPKPIDTFEVMIGEVDDESLPWIFGVEEKRSLTTEADHMKRELVLKLNDNGIRYKMEIKWLDISSLTEVKNQNNTQSMKLELLTPPVLWRQKTEVSGKRLTWIKEDFTGGVALGKRVVDVKFYPGELDDFLAGCKDLSNMRNRVPFPSLPSQYT